MNTELTHEEVLELLPAYVLGTLEPEEMLAVDAYVHTHPDMAARLAEAEAALMQLAYAAPDVPLPADGKERLLARVREETASAPGRVPPKTTSATLPMQTIRDRFPVQWAQLFRSGRWAAIAALVLGLLFWNIQLQRALRTSPAQIGRLAGLPDTRVALLVSTPAAPNAIGRLYLTPDGREGALAITGLPALPPGQSYQFWFARPDNSRDSAAVFEVDERGQALVNVTAPGDLRQYNQIWITREPAGGSPKPTPPHFMEGPL